MKQKSKEKIPNYEGLEQKFKNKYKKVVALKTILKKDDWWALKKKNYAVIIVTHNGVKKIANEAGIKTDPEYTILTQPTYENNYQYTIQVRICDSNGLCTTEIGEVNRSNLGSRGRNNPANMAQKRAFDRAVFAHLGITGLLGEDELEESNEEKREMENLTPEQSQAISKEVNQILAITSDRGLVAAKKDLKQFSSEMRANLAKYEPVQLEYLRALFKKKVAELEVTF